MNIKRKVKLFQGGVGHRSLAISINKWVEESGAFIVDVKYQMSINEREQLIEAALVLFEESAKENA